MKNFTTNFNQLSKLFSAQFHRFFSLKTNLDSRFSLLKISLFVIVLFSESIFSQEIDFSNCSNCSSSDIQVFSETNTKYLGLKGNNPDIHSTYDLIGSTKFSGSGYSYVSSFWGKNWYPIRAEKQILCGKIKAFGTSDWGDEKDWDIRILPNPGFEELMQEALIYKSTNWYGHDDWHKDNNGNYTVLAEVTPSHQRLGNPWFPHNGQSMLVNKEVCVYGPFVREEGHGNNPEIHPGEQWWWKKNETTWIVLLTTDDSNRFEDCWDYSGNKFTMGPNGTKIYDKDCKSWTVEKGLKSKISIPFEVDPTKETVYINIGALDKLNFLGSDSYQDNSLIYKGAKVVQVLESASVNTEIGISFERVCFNKNTGKLQGFVIVKTAIGNGEGKEGFVALQIEKENISADQKLMIVTGNQASAWKEHIFSTFQGSTQFSDIFISDFSGKGVIDGMIDFNGNGIADMFTFSNSGWKVLYDGNGAWKGLKNLPPPQDPIKTTRFVDVNGDKKTDIVLYNQTEKALKVFYSGIGTGVDLTETKAPLSNLIFGDFNGDGKTDVVRASFPYLGQFPTPTVINLEIKWKCQGSWKHFNYLPLMKEEGFEKNVRVSDFNGDKISDIFLYDDGKGYVYWGGTGDKKELCRIDSKIYQSGVQFVKSLTKLNYTDIVSIGVPENKWTFYYKSGKVANTTIQVPYSDPFKLRFGNLEGDGLWEYITTDFKTVPVEKSFPLVEPAKSEPVVLTEYSPGSLKRTKKDGKDFLSVDLNLRYYPGTEESSGKRDKYTSLTLVKENLLSTTLKYSARPANMQLAGDVNIIGTITNIPISGMAENRIMLNFSNASAEEYEIPRYTILAPSKVIGQISGGPGNWENWKPVTLNNPGYASLLTSPPAPPESLERIEFEAFPLYIPAEEDEVEIIGINGFTEVLNDVAYGSDQEKIMEVFGTSKMFNYSWNFELIDHTLSEKIEPFPSLNVIKSNGKWPDGKISFTFPKSENLLQLKVSLIITDVFGNTSFRPSIFTFWNQRISLSNPKIQLKEWMEQLTGISAEDRGILIQKSLFLATDQIIDPGELLNLIKPD